MKRSLALAFASLLLVSCSEAGIDAPSAAPSVADTGEDVAAGDKEDNIKQGRAKSGGNDKKGRQTRPDKKERAGEVKGGARPKPSRAGGGGGENDAADNDSGTGGDGSSAAYPAAGNYVFAQSGFEKFCNATACDRQALPKRQTARITLQDRTKNGAVVITETSASDDRMLRTITTYSRADALITDVYTRLSYEGFTFENEYNPAPPVESLRFPLRDGASWRGRWKDSTSGDYAIRVFGPARVTVGGRSVRAWQVATTTNFRGEFEGEAKTVSWIDPATKAIVKLNGSVDLTSTYGRYVTEFSTSLRSGPRYR